MSPFKSDIGNLKSAQRQAQEKNDDGLNQTVEVEVLASTIVGVSAKRGTTHNYGWFTEGYDTADPKDTKNLLDELSGMT